MTLHLLFSRGILEIVKIIVMKFIFAWLEISATALVMFAGG